MTKFTIHGETIRTATQRRFVVVIGRPETVQGERWDYRTESYVPETFEARKPEIVKRSDSIEVARKHARRTSIAHGYVAVVDTTTGEEV